MSQKYATLMGREPLFYDKDAMSDELWHASKARIDAIRKTSASTRERLGQHLTPPETARLAASFFSDGSAPLRCLDLGAGTGMLSAALVERYGRGIAHLDAIEIDNALAPVLECELSRLGVAHTLYRTDAITGTPDELYDRIILNPPYKKMPAQDERQQVLPVRAPNLYAAFLMVALAHLAPGGECVAIVPRSWVNGSYFAPFRQWCLQRFSLDRLHVYGSRSAVFRDTSVLQETMLVKFSAAPQQPRIAVSSSQDASAQVLTATYPFADLIVGEDLVVRIAPGGAASSAQTVSSLGLCPSTGKVVDFRNKGRISTSKPVAIESHPLVYPGNFRGGSLAHPLDIGKPQWFVADDDKGRSQLIGPGAYVVVKRFTAKEERRRVVAYPLLASEPVALENHLTFIHAGTPRKVVSLPSASLAYGLALWLDSTCVDQWFRGVSGSTQVNSSDIRRIPCPPSPALEALGERWCDGMPQQEIDALCQEVSAQTLGLANAESESAATFERVSLARDGSEGPIPPVALPVV